MNKDWVIHLAFEGLVSPECACGLENLCSGNFLMLCFKLENS